MTTGGTYSITNDPAVLNDPQARDFLARIEEKLTALRDLMQRVADGLGALRQSGRDGQIAEEPRAAALAELDQIEAGADAVRQGIYFMIEQAMGPAVPSPGSGSDLAEGQSEQHAWNALRARLDQAPSPEAIMRLVDESATHAARAGDTATLSALREAMPDYLKARGWDDLDHQVTARLDEIEAPLLTPYQRAASLAHAAIEAGWPRIARSLAAARAEISGQGPPVEALSGLAPSEQIPVR